MGRRYIVPPTTPSVVSPSGGSVIQAPHWPFDREALRVVEAEMTRRGHCLIRAVRYGDEWRAIEGSHRLWVASMTRTPVEVQAVAADYLVQHDNPDVGIVTAAYLISPERKGRGPAARYRITTETR